VQNEGEEVDEFGRIPNPRKVTADTNSARSSKSRSRSIPVSKPNRRSVSRSGESMMKARMLDGAPDQIIKPKNPVKASKPSKELFKKRLQQQALQLGEPNKASKPSKEMIKKRFFEQRQRAGLAYRLAGEPE
jgi:hypothetical protein